MISNIRQILREGLDKTIKCKKCEWRWKESETTDSEKYKCHKCGYDNTPDLNEHLQQAEKVYFNTGKLSPNDKALILRITNGDAFTKTISDIYFGLSNGVADNLTPYGVKELSNTYLQLKNYNKNVFPIKDFDILLKQNPVELSYALKIREKILEDLKKLPSIAIRNLKEEIRTPRTEGQLDNYQSELNYFMGYFSLLSNRDEKIQRVILNKMFKNGSTLKSWLDFLVEKENVVGGKNFTKNMVMKIVRDSYHGDLDIVYNQGNVMVVEVSSPYGIKEIGCNSVWCFTYGNDNWRQWNTYSTNGLVYAIFDFSKPTDSPEFMYVLIKPLPDEIPNYDDDNRHDSPLYDMTNEPDEHPEYVIDKLIGLDRAKKIFNFGIEPKPEPKPKPRPFVDPNQLSLFESLRRKVLKEYLSQEMVSLKRYFSLTDEEKIRSLPEMYWWFFDDFLIEDDIEFVKPKDSVDVHGNDVGDEIEGIELVEWVSRNNPKLYYQFGSYLLTKIRENTLNIPDAEYPAWNFFSSPSVIKNQWLIHFTNDADGIASNGFIYGVDEMDKLGLTCHLSEFDKKYGGYNFAYTINDYKQYSRRTYGRGFKYGDEAVIFNASGLKLYHYGDEEPQVIFYGNTAKNIIPITEGETEAWAVRNAKTNKIIFEDDDFNRIVNWIIKNYVQYRNKI